MVCPTLRATAFAMLFSSVAFPCDYLHQPPIAWHPDDTPIPYYINPTDYPAASWDPDFLLIQLAFAKWQAKTYGTLTFTYAGTTTADGIDESDSLNVVSFNDPEGEVPQGIVAWTGPFYSAIDTFTVDGITMHRMTQCDIVFANNNEVNWIPPDELGSPDCDPADEGIDLHTAAMHEVGHFLGLVHPNPPNGAVMDSLPTYCDPAADELTAQDLTCLKTIYPPPAPLMVTGDLTLSPAGPYFVGSHLVSSFTVVNTTTMALTVDLLGTTGRHEGGSVWDFSLEGNVSLQPDEFYTYAGEMALGLPGNYTFEVSHRDSSGWHQTLPREGVSANASVAVSPTQPFFAGIHHQAGNHHIFIYPSRGDGTFQQEERIADFDGGTAEIRTLAVADFNHDGLYDVFAALQDRRCFFLRNDGAIVFTPIELQTLGHSVPMGSATAGDFTGDGYAEVLVVAGNGTNQTFYLFEQLGGTPVVTPTAVQGPSHDAGNLDSKTVDAEYVDGDAFLDIAVNYYNAPILLYRGNGDGTFQEEETIPNNQPGIGGSVALSLGDFNEDDIVDLIVGMDDDGDAGQAWATAGYGDGTFTLNWIEAFDVNPAVSGGSNNRGTGHCDAFDFNNDGRLDVVALAGRLPGQLFLGQDGLAFSDSVTVYPANGIRGRDAAVPERAPVGPSPAGRYVTTYLASYAVAAFDSVVTSGVTSLTLGDPASGPVGTDATLAVLDVTTSAAFQDSVSLTFPYQQHLPDSAYVDEGSLALHHETTPGNWSVLPTVVDVSARLLHTRVASLSSFAITGPVTPIGIAGPWETPLRYSLHQNVPNPFNPRTTIRFSIARTADVRVLVYDVSGRLVRRLLDGRHAAGEYAVAWDGRDDGGRHVSSGVYFYTLRAGDRSETRKLALVR